MTTTADQSLLTPAQAAALLGVSEVTVRRMVRDGRLPALQLGGRGGPLRVEADALHRVVERSRMRPGPEAA